MEKIKKVYHYIMKLNKKINPSLLASSITFYLILTLIPMVELIYVVLSYLGISSYESSKMIDSTWIASGIFVINLLITSSKLVHILSVVTDEIYYNVKNRSRFILRIKSFFLTILLIMMILLMIIGIVYIGYLKTTYFKKYYFLVNIIQLVLTMAFTIFFISLLYKKITPVKIKLRDTFFTATIIAIVIYFLVILYQTIVKNILINKYEAIYGNFAGIISTLIFLYIASYVFIFGICFLLYKKEYK